VWPIPKKPSSGVFLIFSSKAAILPVDLIVSRDYPESKEMPALS
jgi:hypothetical protein